MKKVLMVFFGVILCFSLTACDLSFNKDGGEVIANLTQLPTPIITEVKDNYVYWDEVPNASSYVIKINNYQESSGNQLKYSIASIMDSRVEEGVQTELHIYVKAKGNQILYSDSEWSNEFTYTYVKKDVGGSVANPGEKSQLNTPVFSYDDKNNIISWNSVTGADGYEILINGKSNILPQMTSCEYRPNVKPNDEFEFSMKALAPENSIQYLDSNWTRTTKFKYSPISEEKVADQEAVQKAQELRIGYGYNFVDDEYFDVTKSSANSIIDLNELFKSSYLNIQPSIYTKSDNIYKDSIGEFQISVANSLNSEVSAGGTFSIYSANVSAGLKTSSSIDFSKYGKSGYLNCYSYAEYKNYQVIDFGNTSDLSNMFSSDFKSLLKKEGVYASMSNEQLAEYILSNYGTHLILGVKTGGRLDYYYSFATNSSKAALDFKNEITANASGGVAEIISASTNNSLSTEFSASLSRGDTENCSNFVIYGGSTDGISASNIGEKFLSWSSSINESNARSIGVSRNGIIYLPTLISYLNPGLGNQLNALIQRKADEAYQSLIKTFKNADSFIDTSVESNLDDLLVYDGKIRSGEYKVAGSGKICSVSFTLDETISNLKQMGYNYIKLNIDYQLREQDNCWIYVDLFDENNKSLYYRRVEHGGNSVNRSYASYTIELELNLDELPSNKFRIQFKAENKIFKDFYVGTVTGKIYAIKKEN